MISRVIIGALLVVSTTAQLDSVFSVDELLKIDQNHVSRVQDAHKDGLKAAYHASRLVAWKPSAYGSSTKAAFCSSVTDQLKTASKLTDASYGIQALATLGCKQPKIAASAVDLVKEAITSKSLTKLYAAVSAADALDTLGQGITVDYSSVVKTVTKLQQSDGKFKQSSSKSSSALYAGMAYHVLAIAFPHVKREQAAVSSISRVVEKIDSLLAAAEGSEASDLSLGTTDRLATTSIVISGALRLATVSSDEIAVTLEQLTAFGSFLISHVTVPDVSTLFYVLNGLEGLNNSSVGKVVALQLTNARLSNTKGGKGDQLQVFLSEVFGAPVNGATIVLKSAIDASSGDELPSMNDQVRLSPPPVPIPALHTVSNRATLCQRQPCHQFTVSQPALSSITCMSSGPARRRQGRVLSGLPVWQPRPGRVPADLPSAVGCLRVPGGGCGPPDSHYRSRQAG